VFGFSEKEKRLRQFRSALSNFLFMYPGGLEGAYQRFSGLKDYDLDPEWPPAKHALLVAKRLFTRVIDTEFTPEERMKIGRQLDSLSMKDMRIWTITALAKKPRHAFPGLHPATVYIATAECVADIFWMSKQYSEEDRVQFSKEINQALVGLSESERLHSRLERALDDLVADDQDTEIDD
jgi:hypothetical protein